MILKQGKILLQGLLTGLLLQLSIGPIFFTILGIILESHYLNGFFAILGAALADFIYIFLSVFGVTRFVTRNKIKKLFTFIGPMVLCVFGLLFLIRSLEVIGFENRSTEQNWTGLSSFLSTLGLTLASPLTIFFWSGIFSTRALEKNYNQKELFFYGLGAGSATIIFLSISMAFLSLFKVFMPLLLLQILNSLVGLVLIIYGLVRFFKALKSIQSQQD